MLSIRARLMLPLLVLLGACASSLAAVEGPVVVNKAYQVTLDRPWNRYADSADSYWTRGDILTQDGRALNEIRLIGALKPGDYVVRQTRKDMPTPKYRADMTELELAEFVTDSLAALGYEQPKSDGLRPAKVTGREGLAMGVTALTPNGLKVKGDARLARVGDNLNIMIFLAPELHFYGAYQAEANKIFDSATPLAGK
jgi:hypothetical protein